MSKTVTIKGGIYLDTRGDFCGLGEYKFFSGKLESWDSYVAIMPHTLSVTLPDDFDPRGHQVAALETQRKELQAQFTAAVTEINARISKLQAIGNEVAA